MCLVSAVAAHTNSLTRRMRNICSASQEVVNSHYTKPSKSTLIRPTTENAIQILWFAELLRLVWCEYIKSTRPTLVSVEVPVNINLNQTPPLFQPRPSITWNLYWPKLTKSTAHLGREARYEALRELAQDDTILQRCFQKVLRVRYVLFGRAEHSQRY